LKRFTFTDSASADLRRIEKDEALGILKALARFGREGAGDVKKLVVTARAIPVPSGDWRVFLRFELNNTIHVVVRTAKTPITVHHLLMWSAANAFRAISARRLARGRRKPILDYDWIANRPQLAKLPRIAALAAKSSMTVEYSGVKNLGQAFWRVSTNAGLNADVPQAISRAISRSTLEWRYKPI
jgi:hypothetical protein